MFDNTDQDTVYDDTIYDDESLSDNEEIDDFNTDLPEEMNPPHLFNCIQSLTENISNKQSLRHSRKQRNDQDTIELQDI